MNSGSFGPLPASADLGTVGSLTPGQRFFLPVVGPTGLKVSASQQSSGNFNINNMSLSPGTWYTFTSGGTTGSNGTVRAYASVSPIVSFS